MKKKENNNFDKILSTALEEYIKSTPEEEYEKVEFSEEHKKKMKELFDGVKTNEKKKHRRVILKSAAIIVLGVVIIMGAFTPKIAAWKEKIFEFFIRDKEEYSLVSYGDPSEQEGIVDDSAEMVLSIFGYLPHGFEYEMKEFTPKTLKIKFNDNNYEFTFKVSESTNKAMDTENMRVEYEAINGVDFVYYYKNDTNSFIWNDDAYLYNLHGSISMQELEKIIEYINYEKIKNIFK